MNTNKTPGQNRAIDFLEHLIKQFNEEHKARLPVLDDLAAMAKVSPVTMLKAISELRRQGILTTSHGKGTLIVQPWLKPGRKIESDQTSDTCRQKWQKLSIRIRSDIINGKFSTSAPLPSIKQLIELYGVCHQTLYKSLNHLVEQNVLRSYKKKLFIPDLSRQKIHDTVLLITRADSDGNLMVISPRMEDHLRNLERECSRARVKLLVCTYDLEKNLFYSSGGPQSFDVLIKNELVIGIMVWTLSMSSYEVINLVNRYLATLNKPITLLDEGSIDSQLILSNVPTAKMYSIASNVKAGYKAGKLLIDSGHQRVAYVSPVHAADWSISRLKGLKNAFEDAGMNNAVTAFTIDKVGQSDYFIQPMVITGQFTRTPSDQNLMPLTFDQTPFTIRQKISGAIELTMLQDIVSDLVKQILDDPSITAIVGTSDTTAILCLDSLKKRNVAVPQKISIVGFDDGLEAFLFRMTSYNFNGASAIRAMLDYIIKPQSFLRKTSNFFEFEGFFTERNTSAKVSIQ